MPIGQGYPWSHCRGQNTDQRPSCILDRPSSTTRLYSCRFRRLQDLYSAPGMITSYILSVDQTGDKAIHSVATRLQSALGDGYEVMSWDAIMPEIKTTHRNRYQQHEIHPGHPLHAGMLWHFRHPADDDGGTQPWMGAAGHRYEENKTGDAAAGRVGIDRIGRLFAGPGSQYTHCISPEQASDKDQG